MIGPIRIQLSRRQGFDLQAASMALNGLPAVSVARPSIFGNPFTVTDKLTPGTKISAGRYIAVPAVEDAIACFRKSVEVDSKFQALIALNLRGKNLACWCRVDEPCHADVLLALANPKADAP